MIIVSLVLAGAAALAFPTSASAQDWKAKYPELTFAVDSGGKRLGRHRALGAVRRTICPRNSA